MGAFGIFVIVLTFLYAIYYTVMIAIDLYGKKGKKDSDMEEFSTVEMEEGMEDKPSEVTETEEGWVVTPPSSSHDDVASSELLQQLSEEGSKISSKTSSVQDIEAQKVIDEALSHLEPIFLNYQCQLESMEFLAEMRKPIPVEGRLFMKPINV